jgi:hypothetical protein
VAVPATPAHCLERTFIIATTPPNGVQFSHPLAEQSRTNTPVRQDTAYENLFHEPDLAPGTAQPSPAEPTARRRHEFTGQTHRRTRRHTAA